MSNTADLERPLATAPTDLEAPKHEPQGKKKFPRMAKHFDGQALVQAPHNGSANEGRKASDAQFEADEHKHAGEVGSKTEAGNAAYVWGSAQAGDSDTIHMETAIAPKQSTKLGTDETCDASSAPSAFSLTHGDIVMLSGDEFDGRDLPPGHRDEGVNLWKMARTPSTNIGTQLGTQDEIIYAIYKLNPKDTRFASQCTKEQPSGGAWALYPRRFSEEIKKASDTRSLTLAANNRNHFVHADEKTQGVGNYEEQASGAYRDMHEGAVWMAYQDGKRHADRGRAMAHEAAAQHYLTDAFSSGHLRTPRASIVNFWKAKYPNFYEQFVATMERRVTEALASQHCIAASVIPTEVLRWQIGKSISAALTGMPRVEFGDLLGKIAHDADNDMGLWVVNDLGEKWQAFGDGKMLSAKGQESDTSRMTERAVRLGIGDIDRAYAMGASGAQMTPVDCFQAIRKASPLGGDGLKYAPEQITPRLDPDRRGDAAGDNGVLEWAAASLDALWTMPVRTNNQAEGQGALTWGNAIQKAMAPDGSFYEKLNHVAEGQGTDTYGLNPQRAFQEGVLAPLKTNAKAVLQEIVGGNS